MAKKPTAPVEKESKIEAPRGKAAKPEAEPKKKSNRSKFGDDMVITLHVDYNPKRVNTASHARFENYEDEMTVADALAAGVTTGDLNWDTEHDFIGIAEEYDDDFEKRSKPVKEVKPKAEKEDKTAGKVAGKKKAKPVVEEEEDEDC
jgi:hypothetical protein